MRSFRFHAPAELGTADGDDERRVDKERSLYRAIVGASLTVLILLARRKTQCRLPHVCVTHSMSVLRLPALSLSLLLVGTVSHSCCIGENPRSKRSCVRLSWAHSAAACSRGRAHTHPFYFSCCSAARRALPPSERETSQLFPLFYSHIVSAHCAAHKVCATIRNRIVISCQQHATTTPINTHRPLDKAKQL